MIKKGLCLILVLTMLCGCQKKSEYMYLRETFIGPFDTITTYLAYVKTQEEFDQQCDYIDERLTYYDQLFDKYTAYDGVNNLYTVNQMAGKDAVVVDEPLIDLVDLCLKRNQTISDKVNIAYGSVISLWHQYRSEAENNNGIGDVPTSQELLEASEHVSLDDVIVDYDQSTIYLSDEKMSLDVGATAKGYAIECIKQGLIELGAESFLLSGGGNVTSYGDRKIPNDATEYLDGCQDHYCVGIQSPQSGNFAHEPYEGNVSDEAILVVEGMSIVTSGDYQRYYEDENGVRYHHLIDSSTLYPATYFRSVSIICEDSSLADYLSSAVFLMPYEEGIELIESLDGVEALWLLEDGKIKMSSGLKDLENIYIMDKERLKEDV